MVLIPPNMDRIRYVLLPSNKATFLPMPVRGALLFPLPCPFGCVRWSLTTRYYDKLE
jgi:hypothetical protein